MRISLIPARMTQGEYINKTSSATKPQETTPHSEVNCVQSAHNKMTPQNYLRYQPRPGYDSRSAFWDVTPCRLDHLTLSTKAPWRLQTPMKCSPVYTASPESSRDLSVKSTAHDSGCFPVRRRPSRHNDLCPGVFRCTH
jgi:hypothetical protein